MNNQQADIKILLSQFEVRLVRGHFIRWKFSLADLRPMLLKQKVITNCVYLQLLVVLF